MCMKRRGKIELLGIGGEKGDAGAY